MKVRDRVVELRRVPAGELQANPRNWRLHPPGQSKALASILERVGYADALIARELEDGSLELIDGHLRKETTPDQPVPVLVVDVTEEEAALLLVTLDPLAGLAETDQEALYGLLQSVDIPDEDLARYLEDLSGQAGPPAFRGDPDEIPEAPEPRAAVGDLWRLGSHRLLCGDATDVQAVERVFDGQIATMVWTDPPYGVAYQTKLSREEATARHRRRDGKEVSNDALTAESHRGLLREAFRLALAHQVEGGAWYVAAPSGPEFARFAEVIEALGLWHSTIVWVKDVFVMGRTDYHYRHEVLFYGWKPGAAHSWFGGRSQDSVWEIPRPRQSDEHPTMKPVALIARALRNSSQPREVVYEPFAGSGSTLVACEQEDRTFVGIEIDPAYCDVIVERWERLTGETALLEDRVAAAV